MTMPFNKGNSDRIVWMEFLEESPPLPDLFEENILMILEVFIESEFAKNSSINSQFCKQDLYVGVEELVMRGEENAELLLKHLMQICEKNIEKMLSDFSEKVESSNLPILESSGELWDDICSAINSIRQVFVFLDQRYVRKYTKSGSIWFLIVDILHLFLSGKYSPLLRKISVGVKNFLKKLRDQFLYEADLEPAKKVIRMLCAMKFDKHVLLELETQTTDYYKAEGDNLVVLLSFSEYVDHVQRRLINEAALFANLLPVERFSSTFPHTGYIPAIQEMLIKAHEGKFFDTIAIVKLIKANDRNTLKKAYEVLEAAQMESKLISFASEAIIISGNELLRTVKGEEKEDDEDDMITRGLDEDEEEEEDNENHSKIRIFLNFKENVGKLCAYCFKQNELFVLASKEAIEELLNQSPVVTKAISFLLGSYCNHLICKARKTPQSKLDLQLNKVMGLFRCLLNKSFFEESYRCYFIKRITESLPESEIEEAEQIMIQKLKEECGIYFTWKIEQIYKDFLKDMAIAKSVEYESPEDAESAKSFNCLLFSQWSFPDIWVKSKLIWPPVLKHQQDLFAKCYKKIFSHRRISWTPCLGSAVVRGSFGEVAYGKGGSSFRRSDAKDNKDSYEFSMSLMQAAILLLFNDRTSLTFEEILKLTAIERRELRHQLRDLYKDKGHDILTQFKNEDMPSSEDSESYCVNTNFFNAKKKITFSRIDSIQGSFQEGASNKASELDKEFRIEAAIVRTLKQEKSMGFHYLISKISHLVRFIPEPSLVKQRIQGLISNGYIEPHPADPNIYCYVP